MFRHSGVTGSVSVNLNNNIPSFEAAVDCFELAKATGALDPAAPKGKFSILSHSYFNDLKSVQKS